MNSKFSIFDDAKKANFASFRKKEKKPADEWVDVTASVEDQWNYYPEFGFKKEKGFLFRVNEIGLPHTRLVRETPTSPILIHDIPVGIYTKIYWTLVGVEVKYDLSVDDQTIQRHYRAFAAQPAWRREELIPYIERTKNNRSSRYGIFLEIGLPSVRPASGLPGLPGVIFDQGKGESYTLQSTRPILGEKTHFIKETIHFMGFPIELTLLSDRYHHLAIDNATIKPLFAQFTTTE